MAPDPLVSVRRRARDGFTLLELIVVISIGAVIVTMGTLTFSGYFQRNSARRAAQVFAQDLVAARSFAVRSQEPVVVRFYESSLWYEVQGQTSSTAIARRRFGPAGDIELSAVTLDLAGDSLVFDLRGMADLNGSAVGTARFSSGATTYTVSFNGMGASKIDQT